MNWMKGGVLLLLGALYMLPAVAQIATGRVVDKKGGAPLAGAVVQLISRTDTTQKTGTATDVDGNFSVTMAAPGSYRAQISYLGYKTQNRNATIATGDNDLGTFSMEDIARELKAVNVNGTQIRAEQHEDTSQFRADAFKTNPDASAEDLVTKMPGVTSDASGVKVNGETVQQVLVDGKPFFGTDPTIALKNLPAEIVDKIQVFDKLSDQSLFTGFDDGNAQKTMNIITRRNKNQGYFGKVYAGYGTDDRYVAGGNLNYFDGDRRISILGLSNNINQQNFSMEDIVGATGSSGRRRGGPGGGGNNFMVNQQNGIAATNAIGLNYSDNWGKKIKISGSYFYNSTNNTKNDSLTRNYFTSPEDTIVYSEASNTTTSNANHRLNARLEYNIDSANAITFTPSVSLQQNSSDATTTAGSSMRELLQSLTQSRNSASLSGYNASGNLLYQHRFGKPRRTISISLNGNLNEKTGDGSIYALNQYLDTVTSGTLRDQQYNLYNNGYTAGVNLTYTEPVGKKGQIMISYNPSLTQNNADKRTNDIDTATGDYTLLNPVFSSVYENTYNTQKAGVSYRIGERRSPLSFHAGLDVQQALLTSGQDYPRTFSVSRTFNNILPNARLNIRGKDGHNLRIMYRTATSLPSVSQMQNAVDMSNPLLLTTGNALLKQTYGHTFITHYGAVNAKTGRNFFMNLYFNTTADYIGTATYIPTRDSLYTDPVSGTSVALNRGSQLSLPVNLDGYVTSRFFVTWGTPVKKLKSNLNFNAGFNYSRIPGLINDVTNYSGNYIPSAGLVLSSNISESLDFTLSYNGSYNVVTNTIQSQTSNNFYNHSASLRLNWIFLKHFVFNTGITDNYYTAFSSTGNQDFILWNSYIGYRFYKNALEARLSVYDLLNQNKSITRTVTETYIENANTQVLQQYFMLQLTYTLRNFKSGAPPKEEKPDHPMPPPGSMPPPSGGHGPGGMPWGG